MTPNDTHIQRNAETSRDYSGAERGARAAGEDQGGERKLIGDHDASLANRQDTRDTKPGTAIFNIRVSKQLHDLIEGAT
jgi:hypothetical protein